MTSRSGSAAKEDAVDRSDDGSAIGGDGRQGQQAHTGQTRGDLVSTQTSLRNDDAEKMRLGSRVATVEKILQRGEVTRRLVHMSIEPASPLNVLRRRRSLLQRLITAGRESPR